MAQKSSKTKASSQVQQLDKQLDWVGQPAKRGRPRKYESKAAAQAAASRAYRARKRAERDARRRDELVQSEVIDLSALPAWRVKK